MGRKDYLSHGLGVQGDGVSCRVLLLRLGRQVRVALGSGDQ